MSDNQLSGGADLSQAVFEANRPYYSSAYAALDRARQISANQVKQSYAEATSQAYLQSQQAQSNIGGTALGSGYKSYLQNQLQQSLNAAYDKFRAGQAQDIASATEPYTTAMGNISSGIQQLGLEQGQNTMDYASKVFEYASDVYKSGGWNMARYNSYEDYERDLSRMYENYSAKWLESGNPNEMLTEQEWIAQNKLSLEDFAKEQQKAKIEFAKFEGLFDESGDVNWDAVKTAVYDDQGNFSTLGVELFDYLMRNDPQGYETYQDWLKKNDKDLYQWSIQRSILNDPSNAVSAMKQLGADGTYSFIERFGGLTEKQTDEYFSDFKLSLNDITSDWEKSGKSNLTAFKDAMGSIKDFYEGLGLADIEITLGEDTGKLGDVLDKIMNLSEGSLEDYKKELEQIADYRNTKVGNTLMGVGAAAGGAAAATAAGVALGTAVAPGLGTLVGGVIGLVAGTIIAIGGIAYSIQEGVEAEKYNKQGRAKAEEIKKALEEQFKIVAIQAAAVAQEARRTIQNK